MFDVHRTARTGTLALVVGVALSAGCLVDLDHALLERSSDPLDGGGDAAGAASDASGATRVVWEAHHESSSLDEWRESDGGRYEWSSAAGGAISSDQAHASKRAIRAYVSPTGGEQQFFTALRWREPREYQELTFEVWLFLPSGVTPLAGSYWSLLKIKSEEPSGRVDTSWAFNVEPDGMGGIKFFATAGPEGYVTPETPSGDAQQDFHQTVRSLPTETWFKVELFVRQSKDFDGRVTLKQEGDTLFDFEHVRTGGAVTNFNAWQTANLVGFVHESDGLTVPSAVVFADDARISVKP